MLHFHGYLMWYLPISYLYMCNDKLCHCPGLVQWTEDCWSHCTRMQPELPPISGQTMTWGTLVSPKTQCYSKVDRSQANSSQHQYCLRLMYFFFFCCALSPYYLNFLVFFLSYERCDFLFIKLWFNRNVKPSSSIEHVMYLIDTFLK